MSKATTQSREFKFVGDHVDDLADGRAAVPGETYKLTDDQLAEPHNQRLLDDGLLLEVEVPKKEES